MKGRVQMNDELTVAFVPEERLEQDKTYQVRFKAPAHLLEKPFAPDAMLERVARKLGPSLATRASADEG